MNLEYKKAREAKSWILSVDPNFFDKSQTVEIKENESDYEEEEIDNYDENKVTPHYEEFSYA